MSPTGGVNYYELNNKLVKSNKTANRFPSPTGVNYYELFSSINTKGLTQISFSVPNRGYLLWIENNYQTRFEKLEKFPSPTGVNYYEYGKVKH